MLALVALLLLLLAASPAWGQPELRSGGKGAKPAIPITATPVNPDTNALDVNVVQSAGGGDGKILDGTAVGEADVIGADPVGTEQGLVTRNIPAGAVNSANSTTATLGAGGNFTGTFVDVTKAGSVVIIVNSDQNSATDGMKFQWSPDAANVDAEEQVTFFTASGGRAFNQTPRARYFRVNYTNGGTPQAVFRLQTVIFGQDIGHFSRSLRRSIDDEYTAQLVRAVMAAKKPNGDYVNIDATAGGNLKFSMEESDPAARLRVFLRNPGDTVNLGDATNPVRTDPTGTTPQPVSGTVTANQGSAAAASGRWPVFHTDGTNNMPAGDVAARRIWTNVADANGEAATATGQPSSTARGVVVRQPGTATSAVSNVTASATNVTCLASNTTRLAAMFYNDSTADAFVKLGATASSSSFTVKLAQDGYYRLPGGYTGIVDCIWSSATGAMRVTELTP